MLKFFQRDLPAVGSVLYRGTLPPRGEEFSFLESSGVAIKPGKASGDTLWSLKLTHPEWGDADLVALRDTPPAPTQIIDLVASLSESEKTAAKAAGTSVTLRTSGRKKNILRDRKNFLRWLRAVMSDDAVVAVDHGSQLFWSPAGLDDEMAHDADLDISALYCLHAVTEDGGARCVWLHTHGLAEMGGFDFDILNPSEDVVHGPGADAVRAISYAIAEGLVKPDTPDFALAHPGGTVTFVPAADFDRKAPAGERALRASDGDHVNNRAVMCDVSKGFLGLGGGGLRASRFLSGPVSEGSMVMFTEAASDLMAERARKSIGVFKRYMEEFAEFEFPAIAKIGYETDSGKGGREHLWFMVHGVGRDDLDATLESSPYDIARMKKGQRERHPIDKLTDWVIMSPAGQINPRHMAAARMIREHKDELRKMMREGGGPA